MMASFIKLVRAQEGARLIEYIVLLGVIAILAFAAFRVFGGTVDNQISGQTGSVPSAVDTASAGN